MRFYRFMTRFDACYYHQFAFPQQTFFSLHLVLSGRLFYSADSSMLILVKKCMKNERMKSREEDDRDAEALSYDLQKMLNMNISINTTLIDILNRI